MLSPYQHVHNIADSMHELTGATNNISLADDNEPFNEYNGYD